MHKIVMSIVVLVLAATACSGGKVLDEAEVEEGAKQALTETVGQEPDSIDCPDDLEAEVGATMRCELTEGNDTLGVTVTVTSIDGDNATYDVEVDG
jgi:Domain of unknown function (DUF4333)